MRSPSSPWFACLLAVTGGTLVHASYAPSSAHACEDEAQVRWLPERTWPAACEREVPTDGLVFLEGAARDASTPGGEGALQVKIQRMVAGVATETIDGEVADVGQNAAVFRSQKPLAEGADYVVVAQRVSPDGTPLSVRFTSAFTTGRAALAPIAFQAEPTLQLESFDKELSVCDEADACGAKRCKSTGETAPANFVRIAVPPIEGGLTQRPYTVSATLTASSATGQAPLVATADVAAVQAGKRSYMVVEVPEGAHDAEGCVTITAKDVAGHEQKSAPVCLTLPPAAEQESAESTSEHIEALRLAPAAESEADAAEGCALGRRNTSAGGLAWLALALTVARLRTRKRST
jgi:hypothetical protein